MADPLAAAVQHHRDGRVKEAEALYRQVLAGRPDHMAAGVNLGHLLLATRRPDQAVACFDRVLRQAPAQPEALYGRAAAHAALQRLDRAEADLRALLSLQPDLLGAHIRLGTVLMKQARMDEAIEVLERGRARHQESADLLANLASAHEARNDLDAAEQAARQAQSAAPDAPGPRILMARLEHRRGRLAAARAGLEAALALGPGDEQRCDALFELGQVLDKLGEAGAAHGAFLEANALHGDSPAARRFDGRRFLARVEANRAAFTRQGLETLLERAERAPDSGGRPPVFFVGFPRSGTTLVERALAAHPDIATTEERSPLTPAVRRLVGRDGGPAALGDLSETQIAEARALFWQGAEALCKDKGAGPLGGRLLVDKLPLNLVDLGYANLLFPEARVLVALRDPRDVCLSCFMQRFQLNDSMINFGSLEGSAAAYAAVMDLWLAYRDSLTLAWREFRYEDLVEDFETVVRDILAFAGLDWHEAVAGYREQPAGRSVATPSYRQVTQKIYRESMGRWRSYGDALAPVRPVLAPFVETFGYPPE